jgi:dTDP-4-amino-4,6-dideoxygalactose transaminase
MHVPFVDLRTQYQSIKSEIDQAIAEIIETASFIMGKSVKEFESEFGRLHDARHCIGTSSGTDALHLALWGLGISQGEEVILPVNTFFATAEAVVLSGASPIFIDCDSFSYNIDIGKLEEFVSRRCRVSDQGGLINLSTNRLITSIIPVHLYGQPAEMDPILDIAGKYRLKVVEDACQAHLAEYLSAQSYKLNVNKLCTGQTETEEKRNLKEWRRVGTIGNAGAFSFYPGKNLGAYGEGGAVTTNDPDLFDKMWLIHDHGSKEKYHHEVVGHNYRLEGMQAAVLNVKMRYIEKWTQLRRASAAHYTELLRDVAEVTTPEEAPYAKHVYHLYVIRAKERDRLREFLKEEGIETGLHYPIPLHLQKAFRDLGYSEGSFPVAEQCAREILSLPMYAELTSEQIGYVVEKIKEFYTT